MIEVVIPGWPTLYLRHLVLDVNGTLALDGILLPGVAERLCTLRNVLDLHILTADTHGTQKRIDQELQVTGKRVTTDSPGAEQKADYVRQLGVGGVAAIGNGANDTLMLREAALSIAVLGPEGLAGPTLREADVVVARIVDALDLLLFPRRLSATLRP